MTVISSHREATLDALYTRIVWAFFLILLLSVIAGMSYRQGASYALIAIAPAQASGKITSHNRNYEYEFTDRKNQTIIGKVRYDSFYSQYHQMGDEVTIIYSSLSPKNNKLIEYKEQGSVDFYIFVCSVAVILLSFFFITYTSYKIYTHKKDDRYH